MANVSNIFHIDGGPEQFKAALSKLFVELEVQFVEPNASLETEVHQIQLGEFEYLRTRANLGNLVVERTDSLVAQSEFNSFFICCVLEGYAELEQGGRIGLQQGDIALLDSSMAYQVVVPGFLDAVWIRIPRYRLDGRMRTKLNLSTRRVKGDEGLGFVASQFIRAVLDQADCIQDGAEFRLNNSLLDVLALALTHATGDWQRSRQTGLLHQIQATIEQNLSNPDLSLSALAQRHGITVRYLNKLFAREGISTAKWIRIRRLERCREQIESNEYAHLGISRIAFANGFNDISNFNRAFKAYFGSTPSSVRRE
jgi:AraC-like DNA-binding protein